METKLHQNRGKLIKYYKITPIEYKNKSEGIIVYYEFYNSPFGRVLLSVTKNCICNLYFSSQHGEEYLVNELKKFWPYSIIERSRLYTKKYANEIDSFFKPPGKIESRLFLKGTPFQVKVWKTLLQIPYGSTVSYKDISFLIEMPKSSRAVANAIAKNPIAFIIPCHRVIRETGHLGGYRWGLETKKALIERESVEIRKIESL